VNKEELFKFWNLSASGSRRYEQWNTSTLRAIQRPRLLWPKTDQWDNK